MKVILTLNADPYVLAHLVHARIVTDKAVAQACLMRGEAFLAEVFHAISHLSREGQPAEDLKKVFAAAQSIDFRRDDVTAPGTGMPRGHGGADVTPSSAPAAPPPAPSPAPLSPPPTPPRPVKPAGHSGSCTCTLCEEFYINAPSPAPKRRQKSKATA